MVSKASEDLPEPLRPDIDRVDVGSLHLVEKLAGIGGKRFHVAPLAFGVNGIESERGFAGAAQTRYDRQSIARNLDVDILQVVLARAAHRNLGDGHLRSTLWTSVMWTGPKNCWRVEIRSSISVS